ncbi:sodium-dependent transporter [Virgibacillus sp. C22-A2]|uniref:Transporter n=1 Tax=Virgibacillus tibetensis TaxID=3042313 RepID=A0ABU6KGV7_9BACI|nr:sodium-dependent transporter [Virgibacillus sp. C22-A2]
MKKQDQWTSKTGFILAAAGSAIGLGAIWKFPYMAGTNGGGIFFLLFVLFTILIAAPILLAEFFIGRKAQSNAISAFKKLAPHTLWGTTGYLGIIVSLIILSFYSVIGGWILSYLARSLNGYFINKVQSDYVHIFDSIIENPVEVLGMQLLFMLITMAIIQGGIQKGIERASTWMMPALLVFFVLLAFRSLTLPGAMEGVSFLLKPDISSLTGQTVLLALGQSFFALSIGISVMVTYASYLPETENMPKSAATISALNIFISLLAGLVIFPAVFALGYTPDQGPGLIFVILPAVFHELVFGGILFTVFLILLLFATLTSAFSLLENIVAAFMKGRQDKRRRYTLIAGSLVFVIGIPSALSFGFLSDIHIMEKSIFDFADYITSNIGMPLGALLISLFVGYKIPKDLVFNELVQGSPKIAFVFKGWYFLIRYIVPFAIILIFLQSFEII